MEDHDDFSFEPVPGLPERLPQGEAMLWQGSPEWRALAVSAFHVRKVAAYFALLLLWQVASAWRDGAGVAELSVLAAWIAALAVASIGILCILAYFYARGTIYTLTTKRIVIRTGLALPVTLNLPLSLVDTASVSRRPGGTGSIAITVMKPNRIAWLVLWPNARPWTFTHPQPLLRDLPDVDGVSTMLARALEADGRSQSVKNTTRGATVEQGAAQGTALPSGATLAA